MAGYIGSKSSVILNSGVAKAGDTMTGPLDVQSTVTADGLTVDGAIDVTSTTSLSTNLQNTGGSALLPTYSFNGSADVGMFAPSVNNLAFATGQVERMRIDASGSVGIGTAAPSGWGKSLSLANTPNDSGITFEGAARKFGIGGGNTDGALRFYDFTAGLERMRIDATGSLILGVPGSNSDGKVIQANDGYIFFSSRVGTATATHNLFVNANGAVGSIQTTNSSTAYNTSSDYRLKTDAQPMTGASARVQALKPVNFEWIVDGSRVDGFLAHEAQEVVPEAVSGTKDAMRDEEYEVTPAVYEDVVIPAVLDEDGNELEAERTEQQLVTEAVMGTRSVPDYQGIDQSKLVPLLTAALQEALTKIDDMETRLAALEAV